MVTDANFVVKKGLNVQDGDISIKGSNKELRFYEGSNYVGFEAPALSADKIWVLPAADGSTGQVLKTDGSGNLGWANGGDTNAGGVNGSASAPTFSFASDTNTGMFLLTGDTLAFSVGGSAAMYMQSSKVEANKRFEIIAGSNSAPGLSLAGDDNTGIYRYAENQIGFTIDGTAQLFIKDGAIEPVTDNDIDLGTSSKEFKDGYFDGTLHCDVLDLAGTEYTSIGGVSLANDANNRVVTATGSGGINGEANLTFDGTTLAVTASGTSTTLLLESTDAGATDAPILELYRNSASPANTDDLGQILWSGEKSDGSKYSITKMYSQINTVDSSDRLMINIASGGGSGLQDYEYLRFDGGVRDVIINEYGYDIDFRIEGDSDSALFFTDASSDRIGIGTTSPATKLDVSGSITVADDIIHSGDTNNKIAFGTDTQSFETGGTARFNISDSGLQIGSGARVTEIEDNDSLGTSDTKLATQGNIKAYVDANAVKETITDVTIGSGTSGTTTGIYFGANNEAGVVAGEVSSASTANDDYIELMNMDLDAITGANGLQTIELTVQIEDETNEEVESFKALVQATEKTVLGTTARAVNFTEWAILYDGAARIGTLAADYDSSDDTIRIRYQNKQGSTATLTATFYAITMQNNS